MRLAPTSTCFPACVYAHAFYCRMKMCVSVCVCAKPTKNTLSHRNTRTPKYTYTHRHPITCPKTDWRLRHPRFSWRATSYTHTAHTHTPNHSPNQAHTHARTHARIKWKCSARSLLLYIRNTPRSIVESAVCKAYVRVCAFVCFSSRLGGHAWFGTFCLCLPLARARENRWALGDEGPRYKCIV